MQANTKDVTTAYTYIIIPLEKKKEIRLLLFVAAETINYNTVISILKARGYYLRIYFLLLHCVYPWVSYPV